MKLIDAAKAKYPQLSRRRIRELLKQKQIRFLGRVAKITDTVTDSKTLLIAEDHLATELTPNPDVPCRVLKETDDFLFLEKPAGVHAVAQNFSDTNTVANWLLSQHPKLKDLDALECGLCHRLDLETSGVMVAAKTQEAHKYLREAFSRNLVTKIYQCTVTGNPPEVGLHNALVDPRAGNKVRLIDDHPDAKLVSLEVLHVNGHNLTIKLITGYRHQIRAQMAFLGCPILGDTLYGGEPADHLHLKATKIEFEWQKETLSASLLAHPATPN